MAAAAEPAEQPTTCVHYQPHDGGRTRRLGHRPHRIIPLRRLEDFIVKRNPILVCLVSVGAFIAAMLAVVSPASAQTASCAPAAYGPSCIFWGQNYNGSHTGVVGAVPNFPVSGSTDYVYKSSGAGHGQYLGNNNGSNWNRDTVCRVHLWYNPNYSGYEVTLDVYGSGNGVARKKGSQLGHLLNNLRSQGWSC